MIAFSFLATLLVLPLSHSLSFFTNLTNITVSINLPVEFSVFITHNSPITLTWTHNTYSVACTSSNIMCTPSIPGYTFNVATSSQLSLFTMRIAAVNSSHNGSVSCEATRLSDLKMITSRATLVVRDVLDFIVTPQNRNRLVGESADFTCLGNKGGVNYVWKRNGTILSNSRYTISSNPSNSTLKISDLTAVDIGEFVCEYTLNSDVITSSAQLQLTDYQAPTVTPLTTQEVNTLVGPKSVSCPSDGYPLPTITWSHGGNSIPSTNPQGPYSNGEALHFDLASESDSGDYTCTANNGRDIASGIIRVRVTGFLGILGRWYVIMGICVACLGVVGVGVALVLSLFCCCYDRRSRREFQEKYEERIEQIKSRRRERERAARLRSDRAQAYNRNEQAPAPRPVTLPPPRTNPALKPGLVVSRETQYSSSVRNPDGSIAYSVAGERIRMKESRPRTLATVEEVTRMKERPPTHLRLPKKAK